MITYGFSVQGKSHIKNNTVCQDFNKFGQLKSGVYIGIVADGVGSARYSDIGSKMARRIWPRMLTTKPALLRNLR